MSISQMDREEKGEIHGFSFVSLGKQPKYFKMLPCVSCAIKLYQKSMHLQNPREVSIVFVKDFCHHHHAGSCLREENRVSQGSRQPLHYIPSGLGIPSFRVNAPTLSMGSVPTTKQQNPNVTQEQNATFVLITLKSEGAIKRSCSR